MFACITGNAPILALAIATFFFAFFAAFSGFLQPISQIRAEFVWLTDISLLRFAYEALIVNQYDNGGSLDCDTSVVSSYTPLSAASLLQIASDVSALRWFAALHH